MNTVPNGPLDAARLDAMRHSIARFEDVVVRPVLIRAADPFSISHYDTISYPLHAAAVRTRDFNEVKELVDQAKAQAVAAEAERGADLRREWEALHEALPLQLAVASAASVTEEDGDGFTYYVSRLASFNQTNRAMIQTVIEGQDELKELREQYLACADQVVLALRSPAMRCYKQRQLLVRLGVMEESESPESPVVADLLGEQVVVSLGNAPGHFGGLEIARGTGLYLMPRVLVERLVGFDVRDVTPDVVTPHDLEVLTALHGTDAYPDLASALAAARAL